MYDFVLNVPTRVFFGGTQREHLAEELLRHGKRVLLVYGGGSIKRSGLYDEIVGRLQSAGATVYEFGGVSANPRHTKVNECATLCREKKIEAILAVGGGSVIDTAKAASAAAFYEGDCWDLITRRSTVDRALPIIAVVTVVGTGSEMNNSCVISNEEAHVKRGFSHELLRPRAAFLDPALTYTVSGRQTACGCADILSHVLDTAYLLDGEKMEMLCMVMESICKAVIRYGPIAMEDPENYEARANLMWASTWALNGLLKNGIRQLAVCHAIEHELSAHYDINHGLGMAILLPKWMRYILDEQTAPLFARFGKNVFGVEAPTELETAEKAISKIETFLYGKLKLPATLTEIGVGVELFHTMAVDVCWGSTLPGLKQLNPADVERIYDMCR